jgi:hypothetical protein
VLGHEFSWKEYELQMVFCFVAEMTEGANLFSLFLYSREQRESERKIVVYLPF